MGVLEYNGMQIQYRIEKSNRKTISIRVTHEMEVIVRAPKNLSNERIAGLVETKANWILTKYMEMKELQPKLAVEDYKEESEFLYRGERYVLKLLEPSIYGLKKNEGKVFIERKQLCIASADTSVGAIKYLLEQWMREEAKCRIYERVHYYTSRYDFGKKVNRIVIKDQKSRWGSCSTKCNLNFSYRLIMAPDEVLDYVVIHELCHLRHMNHSDAFWNAVREICPDYEQRKEWLRKYGASLNI